jgi:hypothetical protein
MAIARRQGARWLIGALVALLLADLTTADRVSAEEFRGGPGLQALENRATGLYEIGSIDFGGPVIVLQALLQNGEVLQVHSRRSGMWLAKRIGSHGGKPVPPPIFDELVTIGGGLNHDIRRATVDVQHEFARAADLTLLGMDVPRVSTAPTGCGAIGCRILHEHVAPAAGSFQVSVSADRTLWGFEGFGIVAIWAVPAD